MKGFLSLLVSIGLFSSSQGFSAGVCDVFFSQEVQNSYSITSNNNEGSCIAEKKALKDISDEALFVGEISQYDIPFKLYESVDNRYGLFIVDDSYLDQEQFIPLVVVLTAVAIDFGLIGVMYGAYATMR